MKILAFVGLPASGKSEGSKISRDMGITVVVMGEVVREEVEKRGLLPTDENVGNVANDLRKAEGDDAIAKRCIPRIKEKNTNLIVVDGIRSMAEVERFKEVFSDDFKLIRTETQLEKRYHRIKKRGRSDDIYDLDELINRDKRELGWGLKEAMNSADVVLENEDTLKNFQDRVRETLEEFL